MTGHSESASGRCATVVTEVSKNDLAPIALFPGALTVQPMPTLTDLVDSGAIVKIDVDLAPRDQPLRLLYGTPQFVAWLRDVLDGA